MTNRHPWMARLSEYVDGELPADERLALERHLETCADCRATVTQLGRVRDLAGTLADREPPRDLWPGIEARIGGAARVLPFGRRWTLTMPQLAAAAALMIVVGAGGAALALRGTGTPVAGPVAVVAPSGDPTVIPATAGAASYDQAVTSLGRVLTEHRDRLDPATVRVLEQSLQTIDRAIARAQEALATDPNDAYLSAHLAETMRQKLNLMRRAAALVAAS
ncbi:MAG: zf-HC2 domain-containing protein [Gemmatimonadota bacterium]|nr:zf-HC2 domain-containing protein [Gemmatimonadota bacterium]